MWFKQWLLPKRMSNKTVSRKNNKYSKFKVIIIIFILFLYQLLQLQTLIGKITKGTISTIAVGSRTPNIFWLHYIIVVASSSPILIENLGGMITTPVAGTFLASSSTRYHNIVRFKSSEHFGVSMFMVFMICYTCGDLSHLFQKPTFLKSWIHLKYVSIHVPQNVGILLRGCFTNCKV